MVRLFLVYLCAGADIFAQHVFLINSFSKLALPAIHPAFGRYQDTHATLQIRVNLQLTVYTL